MKRIRRFSGPVPDLALYRRQAGSRASWRNYRRRRAGKRRYAQLIDGLAALQHGLCGYCEIELLREDRQVEHVNPVSLQPSLQLSAGNMIASCRGGASNHPAVREDPQRFHLNQRSCGQAKGGVSPSLIRDPRILPAFPSLTRVLMDGRIEADAPSCREMRIPRSVVEKTIDVLNLNVGRLQQARSDYRQLLVRQMDQYPSLPARKAWAGRVLLPGPNGALPKFFTTSRSFFGPLGEQVLQRHPQRWI